MKILKLIFTGLCLLFLLSNSSAQSWIESTGTKWSYDLSKVRILTIIGEGFNYEEAIDISNNWKNWGATIEIAGTKAIQNGSRSNPAGINPHDEIPATLNPDLLLQDVDYMKYDLIYFAGGEGVGNLLKNHRVQLRLIIDGAIRNRKYVAAICHAPAALAAAETLKGQIITVQGNEFRAELQKSGAKFVNEIFVSSGYYLTGQWPYFETFTASVAEKLAFPDGNGPFELAKKSINPVLRDYQNLRNTWYLKPGDIPNDTLELIIRCAVNPILPFEMMNNASIRFIAVKDTAVKSDLVDQIIARYKTGNSPVEGMKKAWDQIFKAPVILFVFNDLSPVESLKSIQEKEMFIKMRTVIAGESSSQLATAAKAFGYNTSILGGSRTMVAEEGFKSVLGVPQAYQLVNIIGIGHPVEFTNPAVVRPVSDYLLIK